MSWITSFLFLFGAIYLFERKQGTPDWFQVLVVALVPAIIGMLKSMLVMAVALPPAVSAFVWLLSYPIVFLLLWKMMGLASLRAAAYTGALLVFDIVLGLIVFGLVIPGLNS